MTTKSKQSTTKGSQSATLPCHFCGSSAIKSSVCFDDSWSMHCEMCGSFGPVARTEKTAISRWNTRHDVEIFNTMFGGKG